MTEVQCHATETESTSDLVGGRTQYNLLGMFRQNSGHTGNYRYVNLTHGLN